MPYPEYCGGVSAEDEPVGINNYNALQASFKHRFSAGLIFTASYTFSKFLSDVGGPEEWGSINGDQGGSGIRNFYDLKADWSVDGDDIPHSLVLNYVYDLPVGRGKKFGGGMNRVEDAVVGGWQVSGITTVAERFPDVDRPRHKLRECLWRQSARQFDWAAISRAATAAAPTGFPSSLWERNTASSTRRPFAAPADIHLRQCSALLFQSESARIRRPGSHDRKVVPPQRKAAHLQVGRPDVQRFQPCQFRHTRCHRRESQHWA